MISSNVRYFASLIAVSIVVGCQASQPTPTLVADPKQIQNWLSLYEATRNDLRANVNPQFHPNVFLPKLHSWFGERSQMARARKIDHKWALYQIDPIPDRVFDDLEPVLIDDEKSRTSFAVLTKSFWRDLRKAQKRVQIGFLSFGNETYVSGVYFGGLNLVGLDIFSEPGTLLHELRHADQAARLQKIRATFGKDQFTSGLNEKCLSTASRTFGEMDATSFELERKVHGGIEREIPNLARCSTFSTCQNENFPAFPQISFFVVNMNYPVLALSWIANEKSCGEEFRQTIGDFMAEQKRISDGISSDLRYIGRLAQRATFHQIYLTINGCVRNPSVACLKVEEERVEVLREIETLRNQFAEKLDAETKDRPRRYLKWTQSLPAAVKMDLCRYASGFESIADCRAELNILYSKPVSQ